MELHERLRSEVKGWGSIRAFQREIRKTEVRGASYPAIHSYLKGATRPSDAFLTEAARLLGVRKEYLKTGEGPRTEAEAMSTGIVARKERDGQAPPDPSREVLDQIRTTAHVCLVKVGAPLISSFELSYFVAEVYEERGPQAFFVDYEGWKGPQSLEETAPEVLVSKDDVRRYVQMFLGPMLLWPPARPRWQERAAVSSLLTALRVREFGG